MATSSSYLQPYTQGPVNFRDDVSYDTEMVARAPPLVQDSDVSSIATRATSGVLAIDTTGSKNEFGQTEAEGVLHKYRTSPSSASPGSVMSPSGGDAVARTRSVDRQSQFRKSYAASNMDAMTYVDEDFNYYPSRRVSETDDKFDASLVQNAANMGRSDSRGMSDLGVQSSLPDFPCL